MYHSVTIGQINTWDDWHLIPQKRPQVPPPSVKTNFVEIPGGDGSIDMTDALFGRPIYGARTGSWNFIIVNGYHKTLQFYSEAMAYLHGKRFKCILQDDEDYYYIGRFSVGTYGVGKNYSTITINFVLDTYKYPIDFNGADYSNLQVNGSRNVTVSDVIFDMTPVIESSVDGITVTKGSVTKTLYQGVNVFDEIRLEQGNNTFQFSGTGTVTIRYSGGVL